MRISEENGDEDCHQSGQTQAKENHAKANARKAYPINRVHTHLPSKHDCGWSHGIVRTYGKVQVGLRNHAEEALNPDNVGWAGH